MVELISVSLRRISERERGIKPDVINSIAKCYRFPTVIINACGSSSTTNKSLLDLVHCFKFLGACKTQSGQTLFITQLYKLYGVISTRALFYITKAVSETNSKMTLLFFNHPLLLKNTFKFCYNILEIF